MTFPDPTTWPSDDAFIESGSSKFVARSHAPKAVTVAIQPNRIVQAAFSPPVIGYEDRCGLQKAVQNWHGDLFF